MRTHIVAEMAWGHDGKPDQAIALLRAAKEAGADSFSFHVTDVPNYMVKYYGNGEGRVSAGREALDVYTYLEKIDLKREDWVRFAGVAREIGIKLCAMPNDLPSLRFCEEAIKPELYVVSPASFVEQDMLEGIARAGKPTLFRIGGAYLAEIENAVGTFRRLGNEKIILLHGFQNYPTKLEESDLSLIPSLKAMFNVEIGIADHLDGDDPFAKILPVLALPYGATYVEKHITLDRSAKSEDFESALDPAGFAEMVRNVRYAEVAAGTPYFKALSPATLRYRGVVRKRLVAARALNEGEVLTADALIAKRCDVGVTPDQLPHMVGRRLRVPLEKDEALAVDKLL